MAHMTFRIVDPTSEYKKIAWLPSSTLLDMPLSQQRGYVT